MESDLSQRFERLTEDLYAAMTEVKRVVNDCPPARQPLAWEQGYVLGFFMHMSSVFEAAADLVESQFGDEVLLLSRSVIEESTLLQFLAINDKDLRTLVCRWLFQSLNDELGLWREGVKLEIEGADRELTRVEKGLEELVAFMKKEELPAKGPPGLREMTVAIERPYLYWMFKHSSSVVHSRRRGFMTAIRRREGSSFAVTPRHPDPLNLVGSAGALTEEYLRGAIATAHLLEWHCESQLDEALSKGVKAFSTLRREAIEISASGVSNDQP